MGGKHTLMQKLKTFINSRHYATTDNNKNNNLIFSLKNFTYVLPLNFSNKKTSG